MTELHHEVDITIRTFIAPSDRAKDAQSPCAELIRSLVQLCVDEKKSVCLKCTREKYQNLQLGC
jgi:hypothetical protein